MFPSMQKPVIQKQHKLSACKETDQVIQLRKKKTGLKSDFGESILTLSKCTGLRIRIRFLLSAPMNTIAIVCLLTMLFVC